MVIFNSYVSLPEGNHQFIYINSLEFHGIWWGFNASWWFGTFFIFPYIGNNHPN